MIITIMNSRQKSSLWIFIAVCFVLVITYTTIKAGYGIKPYKAELAAATKALSKNLTFETFLGISQEDPALIKFIREKVIQPPSAGPYNLQNPQVKHFSEAGQSQWLDQTIFKGKRDGFFIEVGAINGEYLSNSLYFERELGWKGLLIEPNQDTFGELMKKGRKAYKVNSALSPVPSPSHIVFNYIGYAGKMSRLNPKGVGQKIKSYPIYSLLKAINVTTIDFFSLDVETQELAVLRTIPWDKLKFKVMCIETIQIPEGKGVLIKFIEDKGFKLIGDKALDSWFIAKELWNPSIKV